ncbi:MAG: hypothetical protein CBD03_05190 [Rhizobiales bacterium TMED143]|nr:hypothetical protein [Rhodobiaceae bacterium]MBL6787087.1 flagellar hook basal-body protein [PS1 clade bacterium]OUV91258.1 MAG: hypothetical protein CBD03_05190 [Rhizobiales bacterium TMED143]CAI8338499.1 MAG: Flagellar basal-body rod protein FlgG [Rhodobiaceae bacterium UBA7378]HCQ81474.1 hypothetical protein [Rhodobiaceae bacterium]|tara:strand:- start:20 stop:802 length:783 start_codon:yes stop_codon:yes gene_type:complete
MLTTARSGLNAALHEIKTVSNNVANASSTGFKKSRSEFADSYGVASDMMQATATGKGTRILSSQRSHMQGSFQETGGALDVAINGEGMLVVRRPETPEKLEFTRNGAIELALDGKLVSSDGHEFLSTEEQPITIPFAVEDANGQVRRLSQINIKGDGTVQTSYGQGIDFDVAKLSLALFADESKLAADGRNYFLATPGSGAPEIVAPLGNRSGVLQPGFLETSNVDITDELNLMIRAQHAFSGVSRLMQSEVDIVRRFTS